MTPLRLITRDLCLGSYVLGKNSTNLGTFRRFLFKSTIKKRDAELPKKNYASYEGDGKTVGFVINSNRAEVLTVGHVMTNGFIMASGAEIIGSMILFPHSIISWHVTTVKDVNEDSLTLFKILEPKLDILVLGYGGKKAYTPEIRQNFTQICRNIGLRFEALPTVQATGLFNFLSEEKRFVAAALIPPFEQEEFMWERSKNLLIEDDSEELDALPAGTGDKK